MSVDPQGRRGPRARLPDPAHLGLRRAAARLRASSVGAPKAVRRLLVAGCVGDAAAHEYLAWVDAQDLARPRGCCSPTRRRAPSTGCAPTASTSCLQSVLVRGRPATDRRAVDQRRAALRAGRRGGRARPGGAGGPRADAAGLRPADAAVPAEIARLRARARARRAAARAGRRLSRCRPGAAHRRQALAGQRAAAGRPRPRRPGRARALPYLAHALFALVPVPCRGGRARSPSTSTGGSTSTPTGWSPPRSPRSPASSRTRPGTCCRSTPPGPATCTSTPRPRSTGRRPPTRTVAATLAVDALRPRRLADGERPGAARGPHARRSTSRCCPGCRRRRPTAAPARTGRPGAGLRQRLRRAAARARAAARRRRRRGRPRGRPADQAPGRHRLPRARDQPRHRAGRRAGGGPTSCSSRGSPGSRCSSGAVRRAVGLGQRPHRLHLHPAVPAAGLEPRRRAARRCAARCRRWRWSSTRPARSTTGCWAGRWARSTARCGRWASAAQGVTVLSCDAAVHTVARVRRARDVRLGGGGGTDMRVGLAAAAELRPRPDLVVVLTDGYTPWPERPPDRRGRGGRASWAGTARSCRRAPAGRRGSSACWTSDGCAAGIRILRARGWPTPADGDATDPLGEPGPHPRAAGGDRADDVPPRRATPPRRWRRSPRRRGSPRGRSTRTSTARTPSASPSSTPCTATSPTPSWARSPGRRRSTRRSRPSTCGPRRGSATRTGRRSRRSSRPAAAATPQLRAALEERNLRIREMIAEALPTTCERHGLDAADGRGRPGQRAAQPRASGSGVQRALNPELRSRCSPT